MTAFWDYQFEDTPGFIETFDELPLWSASFGLLLLKHIELKPYKTVLDLGSGTGFPLFELAERLGKSCTCYGLDPWKNAVHRARTKIKNYEAEQVQLLEGSADQIPFSDNSIDLVVSNLGINNFENPGRVFRECQRVLTPGSKLALTTNLYGHWKEFYVIFEDTLRKLKKESLLEKLSAEQQHRGTTQSIAELFTQSGFHITRCIEETFEMRFLDGTSFLNHHFIKLGWLSSWKSIIPSEDWSLVFTQLEAGLNQHATKCGELTLTVPMAFLEGQKR